MTDSGVDIGCGRRAGSTRVVVFKKKVEAASRQQHSDQRQDGKDNGVGFGKEGKLSTTQYRREYIVVVGSATKKIVIVYVCLSPAKNHFSTVSAIINSPC